MKHPADSCFPRNKFLGFIFVTLLATLLTLPWINVPFHSKGEPREALVVQAMLQSGDWILPKRYNDHVARKPPMAHWLMSLASLSKGEVTEFTARLPSALLSIITVISFYLFLAKRTSLRHALWTAIILVTMLEWHRASITARVDMVLAGFLVLGFLAMLRWEEREFQGLPFLPVFLFVAAFLTKGPVAVVLPSGIFVGYLLLRSYSLLQMRRVLLLVFVPVTLIAMLWYALAYARGGPDFFQVFLDENFGRFFGNSKSPPGHEHSLFYLYAMLMVGTLPWIMLPLFDARCRIKRGMSQWRELGGRGVLEKLSQSSLIAFSIICILAFLIFYSIPISKRGVYLLPIYPFISIFFSYATLDILDRTSRAVNWIFVFAVSLFVSLMFLFHFMIFPRICEQLTQKRYLTHHLTETLHAHPLYYFREDLYGLSFYLGRPINDIEITAEITPGSIVVMGQDDFEVFRSKYSSYRIEHFPHSGDFLSPLIKELVFVQITRP